MSAAQPRERTRRALRRLAWALGGVLLALLFLRAFVFGIYRVDSGSMEPFLHGAPERGELVLVLYRRRPPLSRFDPVVIQRPGERDPVVKRVVGLPSESLQLSGGDLFVDGRRIPPSVARPVPMPIFDLRSRDLADAFQLGPQAWKKKDGVWELDARSIPTKAAPTCAVWTDRLLDGWLEPGGAEVEGRLEVGDCLLELELSCGATGGLIVLRLTEEGDRFDLEVELSERDPARARIVRKSAGASEDLAEGPLALSGGRWHRLRFANVDNALSVDLDGARGVLSAEYQHNTKLAEAQGEGYRHLKPRISFGAAGLSLSLRGLRVLRDLHFTERGTYGIDEALLLGPDQIFVLGDHSSDSLDSRDFGPVAVDQVIGVPLAVVWPPSGWRWLERPGSRGEAAP